MKRFFFAMALLGALSGHAASIQKDNVAKSDKLTGIVVSAKLNTDLSSEYFGYFDFTLENKSDRWITISKVKVSFPDSFQNENIRFVSGRDFQLWQDAMTKIIAVDQENKQVAMATIAALGAGLAAFSGNRNLQTLGTVAAVGAAGAYGAQQYGNRLDSLENAKRYPGNHLMGDTIRVLPGLFVDRWLLVNSRAHDKMAYATTLLVEIETTEGIQEKFTLTFRAKDALGAAKWQRTIYTRTAAKSTDYYYNSSGIPH